jgi:membrane protein DedA with SNARE-associated domain
MAAGNAMALDELFSLAGPYLGIFLVLLACSLGLPLPEDVPLLTGGFLVHKGLAHVPFMIPVAMAGVLGGDCILFYMGKRFGHHVVELRLFRRMVRPSRLLMAERLFAKHGVKILFIGRFLPGLRPMIFMAAGVLRVPFSTFIMVNGLAACISVPTLIILGNIFGSNLDVIEGRVRTASQSIVLGAVAAMLVALGIFFHRRQKKLMADVRVNGPIDSKTLADMPPQGSPRPPERQSEEEPGPSAPPSTPSHGTCGEDA